MAGSRGLDGAFDLGLVVVALEGIGCSHPPPSSGTTFDPDSGVVPGGPCETTADCQSGLVCSPTNVCAYPCSVPYGASISDGGASLEACWNGVETYCNELPGGSTCGCSCASGAYCAVASDESTGQCQSLGPAGSACQQTWQCQSGICFDAGADAAIQCSALVGAPCPASESGVLCPVCYNSIGDPSAQWCTVGCSGTVSCPAGSTCLKLIGGDLCFPNCEGASPDCPPNTQCLPVNTAPGVYTNVCD